MQHRNLLLASFIKKDRVSDFINILKNSLGLDSDKIFTFDFDEVTYLLTYKVKVDAGQKFNIREELPNTIQIHKKKKTFFTINALNKLIEEESGSDGGNINHKEFNVDWDRYDDKIILLRKEGLSIIDITRVFLPNS